jgi:hypothetical protein
VDEEEGEGNEKQKWKKIKKKHSGEDHSMVLLHGLDPSFAFFRLQRACLLSFCYSGRNENCVPFFMNVRCGL